MYNGVDLPLLPFQDAKAWRRERLFPAHTSQNTPKRHFEHYDSVQLIHKLCASWNDASRAFLYTAGQKKTSRREIPSRFASTKYLAASLLGSTYGGYWVTAGQGGNSVPSPSKTGISEQISMANM